MTTNRAGVLAADFENKPNTTGQFTAYVTCRRTSPGPVLG